MTHVQTTASNIDIQFNDIFHSDDEWTGLEVPIGNDTCIYYCPPGECSASSHCCKAASWPTRPVRTRRMVDKTLRRVSRTAREAGSSWSCVASNGSTEWNNPRGAVLTGVDVPTMPSPARGGGMM